MARPTPAARRYAGAAFEIALRDGTLKTWRRDLEAAGRIVEDDGVARALSSPARPLQERNQLVTDTLGRVVSVPALNLILLLLRRGRVDQLPRIAAEFGRLDNLRNSVITATATSAVPLEQDEVLAITAQLAGSSGGRVVLETHVDPGLLGGVVVRIGDRLIDGSVRGRLERLRSRLVSGAL